MELIEREAAKKALQEKVFSNYTNEFYGAMQALDELATIDAAPVVHGHVLDNGNLICGPCSKCGESVNRKWHYCPNCSARMDGGEEHEAG